MSEIFIQTQRLNLLRPDKDDLPFLRLMLTSPQLSGHPGPLPNASGAQLIIDRIFNDWHSHDCGTCIIQLRDSEKTNIGIGGLKPASARGNIIYDIGMMMLMEHQNLGLGSEAVYAFLDYAFNHLKLDRVVASTTAQNHAALHLLHKLNFRELDRQESPTPEDDHSAAKPNSPCHLWELTNILYKRTELE